MTQIMDFGGDTIVVEAIRVGATAPGQTGSAFAIEELSTLAGVTAGTVTASKAVIVDANKDIGAFRHVTITDGNVVLGTSTGTKVGTATSQKLGFWNATPVIQQASAAQAAVTPSTSYTGSDTVDKATVLAAVQAVETLVNRLRLDLVTTGVIKGAA